MPTYEEILAAAQADYRERRKQRQRYPMIADLQSGKEVFLRSAGSEALLGIPKSGVTPVSSFEHPIAEFTGRLTGGIAGTIPFIVTGTGAGGAIARRIATRGIQREAAPGLSRIVTGRVAPDVTERYLSRFGAELPEGASQIVRGLPAVQRTGGSVGRIAAGGAHGFVSGPTDTPVVDRVRQGLTGAASFGVFEAVPPLATAAKVRPGLPRTAAEAAGIGLGTYGVEQVAGGFQEPGAVQSPAVMAGLHVVTKLIPGLRGTGDRVIREYKDRAGRTVKTESVPPDEVQRMSPEAIEQARRQTLRDELKRQTVFNPEAAPPPSMKTGPRPYLGETIPHGSRHRALQRGRTVLVDQAGIWC